MSTRNIQIHRGIMVIQSNIQDQIERILNMHILLNKDTLSDKIQNKDKISEIENIVNIARDKISSDCIYELTKSVFAKDLRRIISYLQISDRLEDIGDRVTNIYEFFNYVTKKHKLEYKDINNKLFSDLLTKIIATIKLLPSLLVSEEDDMAIKIIKSDATINKLYKEIIQKLSNSGIFINKKIPDAKMNELKFGFMIAIKNIERTGDDIKDIAKSILFINSIEYKNKS